MKQLTEKQGEKLRKAAKAAKLARAMAKVKAKRFDALSAADIALLEGHEWSGRTGYEAKLAHLERKRDLVDKLNLIAAHPDRKDACGRNLELFLRTYLKDIFNRPFGAGHKRIIKKLQIGILKGGRVAVGMSRGFGKTSLVIGAAIWAMLYGHRWYFVIISAEQTLATGILANMKDILLRNDLLAEDFPEAVGAIRLANGSGMRVRHYTWKGENIRHEWRTKSITLPTIPGSRCSGVMVQAFGITGRLRGANRTLPDGEMIRPDFAIIDDFQTDESAKSKDQCRTRLTLIRSAVLQMSRHDRAMSAVALCTVIANDDAGDQLLKDPTWQTERIPFVEIFPDALETLWKQYFAIRKAVLAKDQKAREATKFYKANRKAMDAGSIVSWEHAFDRAAGELSALQHAMNILCDTPDAFWSEYQQSPQSDIIQMYQIHQSDVISKTIDSDRYLLPPSVRVFVTGVDVNRSGLHWVAAGFDPQMSPHLAAYGKWPETGDLWEENAPELVRKQAIYNGLVQLSTLLGNQQWMHNGRRVRPIIGGYDRGYEPEVVHRFVSMAPVQYRSVPTRGYAAQKYIPRQQTTVGELKENCHMTQSRFGDFIAFNADYWREVAQKSCLGTVGTPGTLTLFKQDPRQHSWLADHICAEKLKNKYVTDGGMRWEWVVKPGEPNDLLDAFVICFVLAAFSGLSTAGEQVRKQQYREKRKVKAA